MAEAVVQKLRDLAAAGRTIIATIHQPSSQVTSGSAGVVCRGFIFNSPFDSFDVSHPTSAFISGMSILFFVAKEAF